MVPRAPRPAPPPRRAAQPDVPRLRRPWPSSAACWPGTTTEPRLTPGDFGVFLFVLGGWVVSLCLHEFAHAYAAYRAGDHSVEAAGYLTLNPFKYAHPLLSIVLPLFFIVQGGIGLPGGAVYLHPHAFRTRAQRSLAAAVGPLTNVAVRRRRPAGRRRGHDLA